MCLGLARVVRRWIALSSPAFSFQNATSLSEIEEKKQVMGTQQDYQFFKTSQPWEIKSLLPRLLFLDHNPFPSPYPLPSPHNPSPFLSCSSFLPPFLRHRNISLSLLFFLFPLPSLFLLISPPLPLSFFLPPSLLSSS